MKLKSIISTILLIFVATSAGYLIFKESTKSDEHKPVEKSNAATSEKKAVPDDALIVYFFHGRNRCASCKIIEAFGKKAVEGGFPDEIKSGRIVWRDIELDNPENKHFIQDYKIFSISLILVNMENGKQKQWKNLEEVWNLLGNEKEFVDYVRGEVRARL